MDSGNIRVHVVSADYLRYNLLCCSIRVYANREPCFIVVDAVDELWTSVRVILVGNFVNRPLIYWSVCGRVVSEVYRLLFCPCPVATLRHCDVVSGEHSG